MGDAGSFIRKGWLALLVLSFVAAGCAGNSQAVRQDKAEPLAKLEKVDVKDGSGSVTVMLLTDRPVSFTSVRLIEPPKMVIDLAGVDTSGIKEDIKVGKGPIEYIKPLKVTNARRIGRLEIGLNRPANSKSTQEGSVINIVFEKAREEAKPAAAPPAPPEKVQTAEVAEQKRVTAESAPAPKPAPEAKPAPAPKKEEPVIPDARRVEGMTFTKSGDASTVRVEGNGKFSKTDAFRLGKDRIVVDIMGVGSVKEKQELDVKGKCLKKVRMARHNDPQRKVRVVFDLACPSDYEVKAEGKALVVTVAPAGSIATAKAAPAPRAETPAKPAPAEKPVAVAKAEPPAKASVPTDVKPVDTKPINVYISRADGKAVISSSPIEETPEMAKSGGDAKSYVETETKIYTGGRISFDIQDADLDKVVKLLADVAGLNLIMDPAEVRGKVTLKLDNVPWDQALDILLRIYNLDKVIEGNVLRVASKSKLDDERRRELLQVAEQKKLEQQAQDLYTKTFKVNYTTATEIEAAVKKILSPRGDATANPRTNELIVTDVESNIEKAGKLISILDKEVNQIMIEARIVTVDIGYSQSLGISWGIAHKNNAKDPGIAVTSGPSSGMKFKDGDPVYTLTVPAEFAVGGVTGVVGNMILGNLVKGMNLDLTIQALEAINKAEVLAAPKVFTLENQAANITSGTTLYVQTTSASGTKPEPLNANLSLNVTPRVTGDNYIMMDVTATNNQPQTPPPGSTAAISTQAVTTKVLVKNGDTIVLGGVYTKTKSHGDSHIPLLGRIPILKYLFSTNTWSDTTSELLIFITPRLVKQGSQV